MALFRQPVHLRILISIIVFLLLAATAVQAGSPDVSLMGLDGTYHISVEYIGTGKWVVLRV